MSGAGRMARPVRVSRENIGSERSLALPQPAEKRANIRDQPLRFFHRGEMPAGRHYRPALQVVVTLGPLALHQQYFFQENRDPGRRFDHRLTLMRRLPQIMRRFVIIARRRTITLSYPVERHGGAQVVLGEAAFDVAATVAPGAALLHDP